MSYAKKQDFYDRRFHLIGVHSPESLGWEHSSVGTAVSGGATIFPNANTAIYVPLRLPWDMHVVRMWYSPGTSSGNVDLGVYKEDGTKIASTGVTAMSGTNQLSLITTDFYLPGPKRYFMALWSSGDGVASFYRSGFNSGQMMNAFGVLQESSLASGLPATATFAVLSGTTTTCIPNFGISGKAST